MFKGWAKQKGRANRLVIDEAHQALTDHDFRQQFKKLAALASFHVQKIMITASLPHQLESQFMINIGLPLSTKIICALVISLESATIESITLQIPPMRHAW